MNRMTIIVGLAVLVVSALGCSQQGNEVPSKESARANVDTAAYILAEEPEGAVGVIVAREEAKDQDEIVLVGRIGGQKNPWIDGRSAFTVIDAAMTVVGDGQESDEGELCMDDCCAGLRAECTTLVKIVDQQGRVLPIDARELLDADIDDMVVVKGKVQRNEEQGTFTIAASGVHVRR